MELVGSNKAEAGGGGEADGEWMTDEAALWGGDEASGHLRRGGAVGGGGTRIESRGVGAA